MGGPCSPFVPPSSPCFPPLSLYPHLMQLLFPSQRCEHLHPDRLLLCFTSGLPERFFIGCLYPSLSLSFPSSPFSSISPSKAPPLCLVFVWLLSLVAIATEELSSFRQQCRARGCHQPTLNAALSSSLSSSLSDDSVYINSKDKYSINRAKL